MDNRRRAEIRQVVDHFKDGGLLNQATLTAYCERMKIEPVPLDDLEDYKYQVEHDKNVGLMFPLILAELQKYRYTPEFAPESERKAITDENDNIRVNITKIFEAHAVPYRLVDTLGQELGRDVGQLIAAAGTTAFNKALDVMLLIAKEKFGGEYNMKHAADYAEEVYGRAKKDKV